MNVNTFLIQTGSLLVKKVILKLSNKKSGNCISYVYNITLVMTKGKKNGLLYF